MTDGTTLRGGSTSDAACCLKDAGAWSTSKVYFVYSYARLNALLQQRGNLEKSNLVKLWQITHSSSASSASSSSVERHGIGSPASAPPAVLEPGESLVESDMAPTDFLLCLSPVRLTHTPPATTPNFTNAVLVTRIYSGVPGNNKNNKTDEGPPRPSLVMTGTSLQVGKDSPCMTRRCPHAYCCIYLRPTVC